MPMHKYIDENGQFEFDFTTSLWATDKLNDMFAKKIHSVMSDVDFIAETDAEIIFIEYKNTDIKNASNPEAFISKINSDEHYIKIARKYYGSLIYILGCKKEKKYSFVYILECSKADSVIRKLVRNKIRGKLPFELQKELGFKMELINEFELLSIDEWNSHEKYSKFSITPVVS